MSQLHKQHCAISPAYPSQEIVNYFSETCGIYEMRFCSILEPQSPQLTAKMSDPAAEWQGQVCIFFTLNSTKGKDERWWANMVTSMGMQLHTELERTAKFRHQLWRHYVVLWHGNRAIELSNNVIKLQEKRTMSAKQAAAPAVAPSLPLALPGPDALSDMLPHDRDCQIQLICAAEDESYYQGQPQKPGKQRAGYKSKRDKLALETLTASAARKPTAAEVAVNAVSLTVSEKVVHATAHNAPSEAWRSILVAWLSRSDVYSKALSKDQRPIGMLSRLLPDVSKAGSFFNVKTLRGIAMHLPTRTREIADRAAHTLELHRAALVLEHRAADVLRLICRLYKDAGKHCVEQIPGADDAFITDLNAAMHAMGGIYGDGPQYWFAVQGSADLQKNTGGLCKLIQELAATRAGAFTRQYAVFDEWTWVLPVFAAIYAVRAEYETRETSQSGLGGRPLTPADFQYAIERQNKQRLTAIEVDHAPLIIYGRKLGKYFERISDIARVLGMDAAPAEVTEFAEAKLSQYADDKTLVSNRIQTERNEIGTMMRGLHVLSGSAAVDCIRALNAIVVERMREDSYQAQGTSWLMPTPSVPWAANDPGKYLQGGAPSSSADSGKHLQGGSASFPAHFEAGHPAAAECSQPEPDQPGEI